jgi:hypothetical protein
MRAISIRTLAALGVGLACTTGASGLPAKIDVPDIHVGMKPVASEKLIVARNLGVRPPGRTTAPTTYQNIFRNMDRVQVAPSEGSMVVKKQGAKPSRAKVNAIKNSTMDNIRPMQTTPRLGASGGATKQPRTSPSLRMKCHSGSWEQACYVVD